MDLNSSQQDSD